MTVCHTYQAFAQFKTWLLKYLELLSHVPIIPRLVATGSYKPSSREDLMCYISWESTRAPRLPYVSLFHMSSLPYISHSTSEFIGKISTLNCSQDTNKTNA